MCLLNIYFVASIKERIVGGRGYAAADRGNKAAIDTSGISY